jgi:hypothetical protein
MRAGTMRGLGALVAGLLLAVGSGCMDLEVENTMAPDRERALGTADDVESLISGAFNSWWAAQTSIWGANLSQVAFQHTGWQGNNGQLHFSNLPRPQLENAVGAQYVGELSSTWTLSYRALSAAREGLRMIDDGAVNLGANETRARAFAKLVQGLAHGTLALMYDQAFILDESVDNPADLTEFDSYQDVMAAALGYLDDAIGIAQANSFSFGASWMSTPVTNTRLAAIAYAYKARLRTQVARTPAERDGVNWGMVVADLDQAIIDDFIVVTTGAFGGHNPMWRGTHPRWAQLVNFMRGMADQSGGYQAWMGASLDAKTPFLYVTPDQRFPQGATEPEQRANPGLYITIPGEAGMASELANQFLGGATWRWSYYRDYRHDVWFETQGQAGPAVDLSQTELRLLRAEAHYRAGEFAAAADIIDETRTTNGGLGPAIDNTDCVPRLPDGSCGDLFETLKWEQRIETYQQGFGKAFFESRGWGDLPAGTFIHLPVPAGQLFLLAKEQYTYGGVGGPGSTPVGTYGF